MRTTRSAQLFAEAKALIPGGVNSPVRAFRGVGGTPRFLDRGAGARVWDVDGNEYIDYVLSWGPLILGHAHPAIVEAIQSQAARGTSFGAPTELESELARMVIEAMPAVEMVRFVSSGTEAVMSAIRLARAYTGREKVIKFAGCYHGHFDGLLVQAGSGVATLGLPDSPGVPATVAADTLTAPYNDLASVEMLLQQNPEQVAVIVVEPVAGNMGFVLPAPGFLEGLRRLADEHGALLLFDEVMTGFRVAYGGAQASFGVAPDLTTMGKVIGGGLPAAAYGGRREILEMVAPAGPVYQAGTLSGNPLAMAAGVATLEALREPGVWERLEAMTARLCAGFREAAAAADVPIQAGALGSMWGFFLAAEPVTDYASAKHADSGRYARLHRALLERGVYLAPSQFEAAFVSLAHTDDLIERTLEAAAGAFRDVAGQG
ncbi:MAG TPA: glutamate-1-semialdehyde 2,1-aminomutase [Longimicrobiaceae bacterium]|nr:glutamate-1-semialdehyde 2,1-aminomutase [Longimicrobiaceae bacterium]